jgi:hypothetical protein
MKNSGIKRASTHEKSRDSLRARHVLKATSTMVRSTGWRRGGMTSACFAIAVAAYAMGGCVGEIGDGKGTLGGPGGTGPGGGPGPNGGTTDSPLKDALVDSTRFPRLTHLQWENTVRDLLKLSARLGVSSMFTTDPPGSTFGNDGNLLKVTPGLWGDYQKAAEDIADKITKDAAALAKITPAGLPADIDGKAKAFISAFGKQAYRRPLTDPEVSELVALFKQGPTLTGMTDPFAAGANVVLQAILQSPNFVYRTEVGVVKEDGSLGLTSWEMASRLSYSLWNTMPDDALFAAAESDSLINDAGIETQVRRMLDDPRAEPTLADFHHKLLDFNHFDGLVKDTTKYPDFVPEMSEYFKTEAQMFVKDVTVTSNKGLIDILTADYTYVNEKTAPIYGVTGVTGLEFKKVKLDPAQRAGFLTQAGFLAANASPQSGDPIHRGVFVNLKIICADLPPPPMMVPPLPKDEGGTLTMRERITNHTGKNTCGAGCHGTMINPAGFAFENYDALGKWRTIDNTKPVNAADTYPFEDGAQSYNNAVEFSKILAARPQVHRCYTGNWLEYAYGRRKAEGDQLLVDTVGKASLGGASTKELILKLVLSKSFSHRPLGGS